MELSKLQSEVGEWAARNFGSDEAHRLHPLLGAIEEIGELADAMLRTDSELPTSSEETVLEELLWTQICFSRLVHCALKSMQGIRGEGAARFRDVKQASYYINRFVQEQCIAFGIDHCVSYPEAPDPDEQRAAQEDAIADSIIYLADLCRRNGINLDDAVRETWNKVKVRDWKQNPASGAAETTEEINCD